MLFMILFGHPGARPMTQVLQLPFEYNKRKNSCTDITDGERGIAIILVLIIIIILNIIIAECK